MKNNLIRIVWKSSHFYQSACCIKKGTSLPWCKGIIFCSKIHSRKIGFRSEFHWLSNGKSEISHHFRKQSVLKIKASLSKNVLLNWSFSIEKTRSSALLPVDPWPQISISEVTLWKVIKVLQLAKDVNLEHLDVKPCPDLEKVLICGCFSNYEFSISDYCIPEWVILY